MNGVGLSDAIFAQMDRVCARDRFRSNGGREITESDKAEIISE